MPRARGYGSDGVDDSGWGCVYRSVQNAEAFAGLRVSAFEALVHKARRLWGEEAEPGDFAGHRGRGVAYLVGDERGLLKRTRRRDYRASRRMSLGEFETYATAAAAAGASTFVVDDGVSAYAVVGGADGEARWADPHVKSASRLTRYRRQLRRARGWMVLELRCRD